ncbi:probable WRKY transcription factor 70 [Lactuca sativa]|uniref:WRKY domain-containing protein n=1 Tax=Lactuca sativa TaxID=4236 RepID=A0A9R1UFP3_LACSA|nr:probable WRKY transcription factor 70 [Lactuca sativa]KAJ0186254.1 hypothetical protein LSAT_V11C900470430 [Lactuca sativa]
MESPTWPESSQSNRIKAIQELTNGQEWTNKLQEALWCPENFESDPTSIDGVLLQILEMFEKTISIMGSSSINNATLDHLLTSDLHSSASLGKPKSENINESPNSVIPVKIKKRCVKRRKSSWTSTKVTSDLIDDGHAWRKYGQKEILNANHQRSYYRCTYKSDQGCLATKQVQMIEDKPPKYRITYFGNHTCNNLQRAPPIILDSPDPRDESIILNFETKELIKKKHLHPNFLSIKQELKDGFPSLSSLGGNPSSSCNNDPPWGPFTHVPQDPTESVSLMSSWLDHEEMVSPRAYSGLDRGDIIS